MSYNILKVEIHGNKNILEIESLGSEWSIGNRSSGGLLALARRNYVVEYDSNGTLISLPFYLFYSFCNLFFQVSMHFPLILFVSR